MLMVLPEFAPAARQQVRLPGLLIHGGATWNGSVNREQMRDCVNLMGKLVPPVIEIMMDHPQTSWGDACYPVVK